MRDFKHLHILVVEDDEHTRHMLRNMLLMIGIKTIFEADNGAEGLNYFERKDRKIDLVLCDWTMPCMNGLDLLINLRKEHSTLPFLMISGKQDLASVTRAKEAGVNAYLHKPISPMQLKEKIAFVINA